MNVRFVLRHSSDSKLVLRGIRFDRTHGGCLQYPTPSCDKYSLFLPLEKFVDLTTFAITPQLQ